MLNTKGFGDELQKMGFSFYSGVPCSFLKSFINYAMNECEYIAAANEGEAVAISSGAVLAGKKAVVLMQNSGLTNAVSPLASLNYPFQIPILGFVSLRGEPGTSDEPQHELMGKITTEMLDLMQVEWQFLATDLETAKGQLWQANKCITNNQPFFFVVRKGTFTDEFLQKEMVSSCTNRIKRIKNPTIKEEMPLRYEALHIINGWKDNQTAVIATTGKTGRELYEIEDAPNHFYMVGSMGCAASLGLGLALACRDLDVTVIDGDGALLMRMGSLATNGYYNPGNLLHILLDNHTYDSTGGQSTVSVNTDFVEIAAASGYTNSIYVHNRKELKSALSEWKQSGGLTFLHMRIANGSKSRLGRPKMKPYEVKERLQSFIKQ
ncbi:phosphonopyruvate decarboxylase [Desmospora activa]|nr:phosphonopyruvate decarboxylase [Desmospora activa]